jgi:hypothetical protein
MNGTVLASPVVGSGIEPLGFAMIRYLYSTINDFKRDYQPRSNLMKDENGDLLADSHNILNRCKKFFCQLLNVHRVSDVRKIEIHTAEPLLPDPLNGVPTHHKGL